MRYLAGESSAQCGPCFYGLGAMAAACERISTNQAEPGELARVRRWAGEVRGRGACHHPDGAAEFLLSALRLFRSEFESHQPHGRGGLG
jgi:NADH:ubiquinone oxidoreductase subunit F (NADH-binding)